MTVRRRDSGFTLVEILIVVALLGIVMTALSAAAIVVLKVTRINELEINEARIARSVESWLTEDIASTPRHSPPVVGVGGYLFGPLDPPATGCGGPGTSLVVLSWHDIQDWMVDYRLEPSASGHHELVRYTCGTGFNPSSRVRVTTAQLSDELCPAHTKFVEPVIVESTLESFSLCVQVVSENGDDVRQVEFELTPINPVGS